LGEHFCNYFIRFKISIKFSICLNSFCLYYLFLQTLKTNVHETAQKNEKCRYKRVLEFHFASISGFRRIHCLKIVKIVVIPLSPQPRSLHSVPYRRTQLVFTEFQPMRVSEEPVCIYLFRAKSTFYHPALRPRSPEARAINSLSQIQDGQNWIFSE
jgi:hypothetical protein